MLRFRSIAQTSTKIKRLATFIDLKDVYSLVLLILASFGGYFWGSLGEIEQDRVAIELERFEPTLPVPVCEPKTATEKIQIPIADKATGVRENPIETAKTGIYVGSKSGSKYHLPSCPGALRILAENKVWFSSKEDALAKGYTPAANCKGL